MVSTKKEKKGNALWVSLSGILDETVDLAKEIGEVPGELYVSTKDIARMNSPAVKAWVGYFQELSGSGKKLHFIECSPAIVEQINLIKNFTAGGGVESLYAPFLCEACDKEFAVLYPSKEFPTLAKKVPGAPCPQCKKAGKFDEFEDDYFHFLSEK